MIPFAEPRAPPKPSDAEIFNAIKHYSAANMSTSSNVGAQGGNVRLLDGAIRWKNLKQISNYWACQDGGYWNAR